MSALGTPYQNADWKLSTQLRRLRGNRDCSLRRCVRSPHQLIEGPGDVLEGVRLLDDLLPGVLGRQSNLLAISGREEVGDPEFAQAVGNRKAGAVAEVDVEHGDRRPMGIHAVECRLYRRGRGDAGAFARPVGVDTPEGMRDEG